MFQKGLTYLHLLLLVSALMLTQTSTSLADEPQDLKTEFWAALQETRDRLSQLDLELQTETEYFEDALEHSRQGGSISYDEYTTHTENTKQLVSCFDRDHATPGTEDLWTILKRVYGDKTLSEAERNAMYLAATEVFECSRSLYDYISRIRTAWVKSDGMHMH